MRQHHAAQDNKSVHRVQLAQWTDYLARRAETPAFKRNFGVFGCMADGATHFDYFCGAPSAAPLPEGFVVYQLPQMRCAVCAYVEHVSGLRDFVPEIFAHSLPAAGLLLLPAGSGAPEFVERYWGDFDPFTAQGGLDVLVPVQG